MKIPLLILIAVTLMVLSTTMVVSHYKKNSGIIYLALTLLITSLEIIMSTAFLTWGNTSKTGLILLNFNMLSFLKGPFIYFFVRSYTTNTTSIRIKDSWHFLLSGIQFLLLFPSYYLLSYDEKLVATDWMLNSYIQYMNTSGYPFEIMWNTDLRAFSMWIYTIVSFIMFVSHYRSLRTSSPKEQWPLYRWLLVVMAILLALSSFYIVSLLIFILFKDFAWFYTFLKQSEQWLLIVFLFIPFILIIQPGLVYFRPDRSTSS